MNWIDAHVRLPETNEHGDSAEVLVVYDGGISAGRVTRQEPIVSLGRLQAGVWVPTRFPAPRLLFVTHWAEIELPKEGRC